MRLSGRSYAFGGSRRLVLWTYYTPVICPQLGTTLWTTAPLCTARTRLWKKARAPANPSLGSSVIVGALAPSGRGGRSAPARGHGEPGHHEAEAGCEVPAAPRLDGVLLAGDVEGDHPDQA